MRGDLRGAAGVVAIYAKFARGSAQATFMATGLTLAAIPRANSSGLVLADDERSST